MNDTHVLQHQRTEHLSHDRPCAHCGHAGHYYLPCDKECGCAFPALTA